jgi:hypothetical protein
MKNNSIPPPSKEHTSDLVRQIFNDLHESNIEIGYILKQFRRRSFGGILIILTAITLIPGISFFAGIVIIILGLQMLAGFRAPIVPKFISKRTVQIDKFRSLVDKSLPVIERIERYVKPRWLFFTQPPISFLVGLLITGLACVVMLPLPFSNLPPAIALLILSIGLLERDGAMIFIGIVVASIALVIGVFILQFAFESMYLFFEKHSM